MLDVFYFICYPRGDRTRITVIDLSHCVSYERNEWDCVTSDNYDDRDDAIRAARKLACKLNCNYEMFESRYDEKTNERYLTEEEYDWLLWNT